MNRKIKDLKIKDVISKWYFLLISPLVVSLILMIVYCIKKVYPFGVNNVSYYDMSQSFVPVYYHCWDFLHFKTNGFLNWYTGMSCSMADVFGNFVLFPTNLFFLFVKRNRILESMSYFVMLKMALMALNMTIYSYYKTNNKFLSSVIGFMYAGCACFLQYYTNIYHVDAYILLPILVLSFDKLLYKGEKRVLYVILMSLLLICSIQIVFFVGVYFIFKTFFSLLEIEKEKRKESFFRLFVFTLLSFMIASFVLVPELIITVASGRTSFLPQASYMDILSCILCKDQPVKNFMLYGTEFVVPVAFILIANKKFNKRFLYRLIMVLLFAIPIIFEGTNILLHAGSYVDFPMRFGFILAFESLCFLMEAYSDLKNPLDKISNFIDLLPVALIPFAGVVLLNFLKYFKTFGIRDLQLYKSFWLVFIVDFVVFAIILLNNKSKMRLIYLAVYSILMIGFGTYGFIAPEFEYYAECYDDSVVNTYSVSDEFNDFEKLRDKVKDCNNFMSANFAFVLGQSTSSGWVNGTNPLLFVENYLLGYNQFYLRCLDQNGTAFGDMLMGYDYALHGNGDSEFNDLLYSEIPGKNNLTKFNYSIDFGYVTEDYISSDEVDSLINYQNQLALCIDDSSELMSVLNSSDIIVSSNQNDLGEYEYVYNIDFDKDSILYIYGGTDCQDCYNVTFDENVSNSEYQNYLSDFPNASMNGYIECGSYQKGDSVSFTVNSYSDAYPYLDVAIMDVNVLNNIYSKLKDSAKINKFDLTNRKLTLNIESDKDGIYTIPVSVSDSWKVKVNGEKRPVLSNVNGTLMAFEVKEGNNEIEIVYNQKGAFPGLLLSLVGIFLTVVTVKFWDKIKLPEIFSKALCLLFYGLFGIGTLVIYIIPIIYQIFIMITNQISYADIWMYW